MKKHVPLYSESPQEKKLNEIELVGLAAQLSGVSTEDFMRAAALDCAVAVVQQARKRTTPTSQEVQHAESDNQAASHGGEQVAQEAGGAAGIEAAEG